MRSPIRAIVIALAVCLGTHHALAQDKPDIYVQTGHGFNVTRVAFSPDGAILASASADKTIKLWDLKTWREIRTLRGHTSYLNGVAFSPDGALLASASDDKTVKLWDVASGKELRTLSGHTNFVNAVAFSPDGKLVASGSADNTIRFWDVASGNLLRTLTGHSDAVRSIAFSTDGKFLVSGSADETVRLWDVATGTPLRSFAGADDWVQSVAFSPDGVLIAAGTGQISPNKASSGKSALLWDVASGRLLHTLNGHTNSVDAVAFSPDGKLLASGSGDNTVRLWDVASGGALRTLSGHTDKVLTVAFAPDGKSLASAGWDRMIKFWDPASGSVIHSIGGHRTAQVAKMSADGKILAVGYGDSQSNVMLWNPAIGEATRSFNQQLDASGSGTGQAVLSLAFSPNGLSLATSGWYNDIELWDVAGSTKLHNFGSMDKSNYYTYTGSLAFSPNGQTLATAGKTIQRWDVASGNELQVFNGIFARLSSPVQTVAYSPDGKLIASGNLRGEVKLWDAANGSDLRTMTGHANWVQMVAFTPDGKLLASGSLDNTIKLWDVASGALLRTLTGHTDGVQAIAVSPDGRVLASAGNDKIIKLWDIATGRALRDLSGHSDLISSVTFSPDGQTLISASYDLTVRLWDVATGAEKAELYGFSDGEWIAMTPEGYFASSSAAAEDRLEVRVGDRIFGIGNYREKFYRPELVRLALGGQKLAGFADLGSVKLAPTVQLVDLPQATTTPRATVRVRISDGGGGIGRVRLFLNGAAVLQDDTASAAAGGTAVTRSYAIRLTRGRDEIKAVAFNADGSMQSNPAAGVIDADIPDPPTLHAIVVGIQSFKNKDFNLKFPVADAQLFADTLRQYSAPIFGKLDIKLLTTPAQTSRDAITQALKALQATAGPDDLFVFYVASHGVVDRGEYFLVTSNVDSVDKLESEAISKEDLTGLLANIPAPKKLLIIDTCHSEALGDAMQLARLSHGMDNDTAVTLIGRSIGLAVLTASTTDQEALEGYKNHGLLTYIVSAGLAGEADVYKAGVVNTDDITGYVRHSLPKLAQDVFKSEQHPTAETNGEEFAVTKVSQH